MAEHQPIKPGVKTSEFGLTIVATIIASLIASGVIDQEPFDKIITVLATILPVFGYTISRGIAKKGS